MNMQMRLTTWQGVSFDLPVLLRWELCYTGGVPCDSFTASCVWDESLAEFLPDCCRFGAFEDGKLRLYGVVDDYTVESGTGGRVLTVSGRGLAALLLDNESTAAAYQRATMEEIVRNHVSPYGIRCEKTASLQGPYQVASGCSQWKALEDFTRAYGDFSPYITPAGRLIAAPYTGTVRHIGGKTPVTSLRRRTRRHGVVSEVLVVDKKAGTSRSVRNEDFLRKKGSCRRVLYLPGQGVRSARYTGEYQIQESEKDAAVLELTLPTAFAAWPGDRLMVELGQGVFDGCWQVKEALTCCGSGGVSCEVTAWKE